MKIALVHVSRERSLPLGILYLAAYARKYGGFGDIKIIEDNIEKNIKKFKPDVVGFSSFTYDFNKTLSIARQVKIDMDIPILIGGIHFSTMKDLSGVFDVGVVGEGEETFLELMQSYERYGEFKHFNEIAGVVYPTGVTKPRKLITPLDNVPFPARDLIDIDRYFAPGGVIKGFVRRGAHMMTSRGCPYRCAFCQSSRYWYQVRYHSPEYIVSEIKELKDRYKVKAITFYDDLFVADRKRVTKISELIKAEGISEDLIFSCQARVDLIDKKLIVMLKEMGVVQVGFGFESGSDKILKEIKSGNVSVEKARKAIEICKSAGMTVAGNFIIGSPNETLEDAKKTLDFIRANPIDIVNVHLATPLPQTPWWDYAISENLIPKDIGWEDLDMSAKENFEGNILLTKSANPTELYKVFTDMKNEENKRFGTNINFKMGDIINLQTFKKAIKNPKLISKYLPIIFGKRKST